MKLGTTTDQIISTQKMHMRVYVPIKYIYQHITLRKMNGHIFVNNCNTMSDVMIVVNPTLSIVYLQIICIYFLSVCMTSRQNVALVRVQRQRGSEVLSMCCPRPMLATVVTACVWFSGSAVQHVWDVWQTWIYGINHSESNRWIMVCFFVTGVCGVYSRYYWVDTTVFTDL